MRVEVVVELVTQLNFVYLVHQVYRRLLHRFLVYLIQILLRRQLKIIPTLARALQQGVVVRLVTPVVRDREAGGRSR